MSFSITTIQNSFIRQMQDAGFGDIELTGEEPVTRLSGGYCRDCYKITTNKGGFVLSCFTFNWQKQNVPFIHDFMNHVSEKGVSLAKPVTPFGRLNEGAAFEIVPFISGENLSHFSEDQVSALGNQLGKMHAAALDFSIDARKHRNQNALSGWRALAVSQSHKLWIGSEYAGFSYLRDKPLSVMKNSLSILGSLLHRYKLPQGIIHGDMNRYNVLWSGDSPTFLDFERCRQSDFLYEVAKTMMEFIIIPGLEKGEKDFAPKIGAFLNAYHHQRGLTADEISALPIMLQMHSVLAGVKQAAMAMGRRYPQLPQGTMLQSTIQDLTRDLDFGAMLKEPLAEPSQYRLNSAVVSR